MWTQLVACYCEIAADPNLSRVVVDVKKSEIFDLDGYRLVAAACRLR